MPFFLQNSFLAIFRLISQKPVQRTGIGEKCGFFATCRPFIFYLFIFSDTRKRVWKPTKKKNRNGPGSTKKMDVLIKRKMSVPEQTGALQIACFGFSAISWLPFILATGFNLRLEAVISTQIWRNGKYSWKYVGKNKMTSAAILWYKRSLGTRYIQYIGWGSGGCCCQELTFPRFLNSWLMLDCYLHKGWTRVKEKEPSF